MPIPVVPGRRSFLRPSQPLPVIIEDVVVPPTIPQRSPRRLTVAGQGSTPVSLGSVLRSSDGSLPDRKSEAPKEGIREHEWIVKRGGWYRLVLGALLLVGLIVGLAVGLTIGLGQRTHPASPAVLPADLFPAGSYAFTTALTNISTGCTANPSTWRCFPYSTFDPATPTLSTTTYFWIIEPVTSYSYAISSSENPFAPSFANITLTLLDGNQYTERFTFSFTLEKTVTASAPLSDNDEAATCWFRNTVIRVTIWTRMRANYPTNISQVAAPVNATNVFAPWPFAVEVTQESTEAPECRDAKGREVGGDLRPKDSTACRCEYTNHDLPQSNTTETTTRLERFD